MGDHRSTQTMGLPVIYYCCSVQINMDGSASLPLSNEITISGNSIQFLFLLLIVIGSDMHLHVS